MIDPAQQTQEKSERISVLTAVGGAFCSKYVIISFIAALLAVLVLFHSSSDLTCFADTLAAAVLSLIIWIIQYMCLRRYGISRKMMLDNKKSVDPRLSGSLGDLNSLGSTLGTLAAISVILSKLFIIDGGVFDSETIAVPLIESLASAISAGSVISLMTSRPSLRCSLYIITGRTTGTSGDELLKKTCRASNNAVLMKRLRKTACVRVAAAVAVSVTIVMTALSGAGSAFSCTQTAFLCMLAVWLSSCCPKGGEEKLTEEKIPLISKKSKGICILNSIAFVIIAFFFVFSFPFRSVYTDYTPVLDYEYEDSVAPEGVEIFSIPESGDESAALFNGVFLACAFMIAVISGVYALSGGFESITQVSYELISAVVSAIAAAVTGLVTSAAAIDTIQYLVAMSTACLLILINLIAALVTKNKSAEL